LNEFFETEKKKAQDIQWVSDCAKLSQLLAENHVFIQWTLYSRKFVKGNGWLDGKLCSILVNVLFVNFKINDVNRFLFFVNTDIKW